MSDELKSTIGTSVVKVVIIEVPMHPLVSMPPQKERTLIQHDDILDFLRGLGFMFTLANNQAFDWGKVGFKIKKAAS